MQACHALGFVERQLKSIIKHSGNAIQPVYIPTMCGRSFLEKNDPLMLPVSQHTESSAYSSRDHSATSEDISSDSQQCKKN